MSETKVVIAGSKTIENRKVIFKTLDQMSTKTTVDGILTGGENGVESIAIEWAEVKDIPVEKFPIKWNDLDVEGADVSINKFDKKYNRNAPKIRNKEMLDKASHLIAIWDGQDIGTKILFEYAKKRGLPVKVFLVSGDEVESHKVDVKPYEKRTQTPQEERVEENPSNDESELDSDWSDEVL